MHEQIPAALAAPANAVSFGGDRVDVVAVGSDSRAWHTYQVGGSPWKGWERLSSTPVVGQISVTSWTPGSADRLDLIARGPANDCWHLFFDSGSPGGWGPRPGGPGTPTAWYPLGGVLNNDPVSASWGPNRIDVVAVGGDNRLYHRYWDGAWQLPQWEPINTFGTHGRPSLSASAVGRLDVVTLDENGQVAHAYAGGGSWAKTAGGGIFWETLPSPNLPFRGNPLFVPGPGDSFHVFAVGQDLSLYTNTFYAGHWSGWKYLNNGEGHGVGDNLSAVLTPNGEITVVMEGRGILAGKLLYVIL